MGKQKYFTESEKFLKRFCEPALDVLSRYYDGSLADDTKGIVGDGFAGAGLNT